MSKSRQNFSSQLLLTEPIAPGSFDDDTLVRSIVTDSIKQCDKKREQIAEEMTFLIGRPVTVAMLNTFTAESKENHRWPSAWTRAFCHVTGDARLIRVLAERAGLVVITQDEAALLELGRQYLIRKQAEEQVQIIERTLRVKGDIA